MVQKSKRSTGSGEQQALGRVLKEAMKSGKYTIGTKEVVAELKSAKLVIAASRPSPSDVDGWLVKESEKSGVPLVRINQSSSELGKMVGRHFRVSAIALRVVAEGDFRELVGSASRPPKAAE